MIWESSSLSPSSSAELPFAGTRENAPWRRQRDQVLSGAASFVHESAETSGQRRLLGIAVESLRAQALQNNGPIPCIHLPLLVYGALRGNDDPAVPLSVATSLLYAGIDLFDDLADGDLPACWDGVSPSEVSLTAATLLCALPQMAVAGLNASPDCLAALHRTLAEGLLRMSAGQQRDIATSGSSTVRAEDVEGSVSSKSGDELAMFASLAAWFAGAPAETAATYAQFGRALGTGGQLASDCYDLFTAAHSRDLANGTRSLPIAIHLDRLTGDERMAFLCLLEDAIKDAQAQEAVRLRLRESGVLRHCAFVVEIYCQRALRLLDLASPLEPGGSGLRAMASDTSFFPAA